MELEFVVLSVGMYYFIWFVKEDVLIVVIVKLFIVKLNLVVGVWLIEIWLFRWILLIFFVLEMINIML